MVRTTALAPLTLVLIAGAAVGTLAWRPAPTVAPLVDEESPLHDQMEEMNAAMRFFLKTGASAENRVKALETVAKFQGAIVASKSMTPATAAQVEEAKRAEFVTGYRKMLVEVLATSCRLEAALLEGKYDDANRIAREDLAALKKSGHDKYEGEEH